MNVFIKSHRNEFAHFIVWEVVLIVHNSESLVLDWAWKSIEIGGGNKKNTG